MAASKYYVVWVGKKTGVYGTWKECQEQVNGFPEAKYKSFETKAQADQAFKEGWKGYWGKGSSASKPGSSSASAAKGKPYAKVASKSTAPVPQAALEIDYDSISVDVGTRGNPGPVEYKGVDTQTGDILFYVGPIPNGTNNLGEFIAVVHALDYLKKQGSGKTIYSDSRTALAWLRNQKIASSLTRDESTKRIWELADWALEWLRSNSYSNQVVKWNTEEWGEIRADFGRK
ncbi:ribonuclease H [Paenibacillus sp. NPDC058174]|uniref:ribonuclease H n=1 Tax=Paenibacillus sp. NPDC058174 TaxID=3346366 RepID=UPI0036DEBF11